MEIKVNREIREYNEAIFMGLSLRQVLFSLLTIGVAVLVYFLLRARFALETLSWICVLCAAPFAAFGFVRLNGLYLEQLLLSIAKTLLIPSVLLFQPTNAYESKTEEAKRH